jgi:GNAT superfamily N-acetyltransferase
VYERDHGDEFLENHFPKLFKLDGVSIGTVRIDLSDNKAWFRLVALIESFQGKCFGSKLMKIAEQFAIEQSKLKFPKMRLKKFSINSAKEATGFYEKIGYETARPADWIYPDHSLMTKMISNGN